MTWLGRNMPGFLECAFSQEQVSGPAHRTSAPVVSSCQAGLQSPAQNLAMDEVDKADILARAKALNPGIAVFQMKCGADGELTADRSA